MLEVSIKKNILFFIYRRSQPVEDVEVPRMDQNSEYVQIPGLNKNQVDNIDLPGVDGWKNEAPQIKILDANNDVIEIDDLNIAQPEPNVIKQDSHREVKTKPLTGVETIEEPMELIESPTVPAQVMQEPAAGTGEIPVIFWSSMKRVVQ